MDQFDAPNMPVAGILRRCQRIASLRGDGVALAWLGLEATDVAADFHSSGETKRKSLAARLLKSMPAAEANEQWTAEYQGYLARRRRNQDSEEIIALSVQQIEGSVQMLRDQEASLVDPPPGMHTYDLGKYVADQQRSRTTYLTTRIPLDNILARVRDRLWEFLTDTEYELTFGEATAETFDRLRSYVDRQLTSISPPALEQFQTAYRRLKAGGAEDRAHALTSCRRVLKTLADVLYPATPEPVIGSDGRKHTLNDAAFINRLLQYISDTVGKHENGAVVQATLEDVDRRLSALNELASKGVHADVSSYEVDTCVVQTYLLVADVLRIRERA